MGVRATAVLEVVRWAVWVVGGMAVEAWVGAAAQERAAVVARAAMAKRAVGEMVAVTQAAATRAVATWVTAAAE